MLGFIYVPILLITLLSFQGPQGGATFPITDPGTLWYRSLSDLSVITDHPDYLGQAVFDFRASIVNSLKLAVTTAVVSTAIAMAAAQAMRSRFRGARLATYAILLGIVTPGLAVSLGLVTVSSEFGITAGLFTTGIVAHVVWTMPFSFLLFMVLFNRFDRRVEEAAYTLGASRLETFFTVTVPIMKPAVIGSFLFAFMLSFDEYAHSIFIMGADRTLPPDAGVGCSAEDHALHLRARCPDHHSLPGPAAGLCCERAQDLQASGTPRSLRHGQH